MSLDAITGPRSGFLVLQFADGVPADQLRDAATVIARAHQEATPGLRDHQHTRLNLPFNVVMWPARDSSMGAWGAAAWSVPARFTDDRKMVPTDSGAGSTDTRFEELPEGAASPHGFEWMKGLYGGFLPTPLDAVVVASTRNGEPQLLGVPVGGPLVAAYGSNSTHSIRAWDVDQNGKITHGAAIDTFWRVYKDAALNQTAVAWDLERHGGYLVEQPLGGNTVVPGGEWARCSYQYGGPFCIGKGISDKHASGGKGILHFKHDQILIWGDKTYDGPVEVLMEPWKLGAQGPLKRVKFRFDLAAEKWKWESYGDIYPPQEPPLDPPPPTDDVPPPWEPPQEGDPGLFPFELRAPSFHLIPVTPPTNEEGGAGGGDAALVAYDGRFGYAGMAENPDVNYHEAARNAQNRFGPVPVGTTLSSYQAFEKYTGGDPHWQFTTPSKLDGPQSSVLWRTGTGHSVLYVHPPEVSPNRFWPTPSASRISHSGIMLYGGDADRAASRLYLGGEWSYAGGQVRRAPYLAAEWNAVGRWDAVVAALDVDGNPTTEWSLDVRGTLKVNGSTQHHQEQQEIDNTDSPFDATAGDWITVTADADDVVVTLPETTTVAEFDTITVYAASIDVGSAGYELTIQRTGSDTISAGVGATAETEIVLDQNGTGTVLKFVAKPTLAKWVRVS